MARDFAGPVPGMVPSVFDQPAYPRWRRLLMRDAVSARDTNGVVVGGINVPGGADNGITETAATSQITCAVVGADWSRPANAAEWFFDIRNQTNRLVTTAQPLAPEFLIEVVSIGTANAGICVVSGFTNSLTFAAQHLEAGVHDDATGRRLRAGSSSGVVDQTAAAGLVYTQATYAFGNGAISHTVVHAMQASGALTAANRKVANTSNVDAAGQLYAFFSIGRSIVGGANVVVGVRAYIREPIMQMNSYLP